MNMPPPPAVTVDPAAKDLVDVSISRRVSLGQSHRSIAVPRGGSFWRKLAAFAGPGYLIAVGYMDPGNWATDLAGGSAYGYSLLSVILFASLLAMVLQALAAKLGIATGLDLAQACRDTYSRATNLTLWALCELAIVACDLAEVLGTAIALKLLFGLPLAGGVILTGFDVFLILALLNFGFRKLEAFIVALLVVIGGCFAWELAISQPAWGAVVHGLVPTSQLLADPNMLYIAIGIVGATVMPHNLYLHSSIVQTRRFERTEAGKREAVRLATIDSSIALTLALFVNAAILILAASTFHVAGRTEIADLASAYHLLSPMLGASAASVLFAAALLAAGQNSTVTGTLAGQIVAEGFLDLKMAPWIRRTITRALAIVPAVTVVILAGDAGATKLLIASQVVLSLQLPFAVVPLIRMTSDHSKMGALVNSRMMTRAAWAIAGTLIFFNFALFASFIF
jgi:manganese transport protein